MCSDHTACCPQCQPRKANGMCIFSRHTTHMRSRYTDPLKSVQTDPTQSFAEYKENQDITAPPDPIAEGTTSDVPIHGEKTNILFHPTPSVSYQPMYEHLERRGTGLCIGIVCGIIFVGRMFGTSLWALVLLAACIASGVWLWVTEVIRSGREMEWSSEQLRGQTVPIFNRVISIRLYSDRPYRQRQTCSPSPSNG